jgi:hypothetical protein
MGWQDFVQRVASMAGDLLRQEPGDAALRRIVSSAVESVEIRGGQGACSP